jgi:Putative auto-transporter adhesin, head GIN domain
VTVAPSSVHTGRGEHRLRWVLVTILAAFLVGGLTVALLYQFDVLGGSSTTTSYGSATEGSGVAATQARDVASFTRVDLAGSNNVVIHVGEKQSVLVKADDNLIDRVTTHVRSGELVIGNTPGSFTTRTPMSVRITVPALDALTLTGSGNMVVDGIDARSFTVTLPGSGTLTGSGTATRLDVTVGGSGVAQFTRLVANGARAVVSGSGSIFVTATGTLDAAVSGSGAIFYAGNPPDVTKSVTGSGAITGTS